MDATIKCERNTKSGGLNRACSRTVKIPTLQLSTLQKQTRTHTQKNNVGSATQQQMERHVIKVAMRGGQSPAMTEPILPLHLFALQVAVINHCRGGLGPILVSLKLGPGGDGSQYTPLLVSLRNSRQPNLGKLSPKFLVNARQGF